jgi:hypothetical protein
MHACYVGGSLDYNNEKYRLDIQYKQTNNKQTNKQTKETDITILQTIVALLVNSSSSPRFEDDGNVWTMNHYTRLVCRSIALDESRQCAALKEMQGSRKCRSKCNNNGVDIWYQDR